MTTKKAKFQQVQSVAHQNNITGKECKSYNEKLITKKVTEKQGVITLWYECIWGRGGVGASVFHQNKNQYNGNQKYLKILKYTAPVSTSQISCYFYNN